MNRVNCNYEPESFTLFFFFTDISLLILHDIYVTFEKIRKKHAILKKEIFLEKFCKNLISRLAYFEIFRGDLIFRIAHFRKFRGNLIWQI